MKKMSKTILVIILISLTVISIGTSVFFFFFEGGTDPGSLKGQAVSGTDKITGIGNQLITIISTVGSVAAVIVLIVLGLKYMMGSAEEKAEYKKTLLPYVIGAVMIFAASTIAGVLYGFLTNVNV